MTQPVEAGRIWGRGTEWDAVRALLASEAATEMGRERARTAEPFSAASEVHTALEITAQARLALAAEGAPPLDGVPDVRATLERCGPEGSVLDGAELALLIPALDAGPRLFAYGRALEAVAPLIARNAQRIPRLSDVRDGLRRALDDDGALTDRASARLGQVRREIREGRRRVVADLERLIQSEGERVFAERFVTLRHGRYVVPVRAESRGRVRGIVHDRSQSGQTLFVEPEATVESNNDLVQLVREEEQESARILAELTARVRLHADDIATLMEAVGDLDWAFARASLAERMQATRPVVEAEGDVCVRAARHPLLLAQSWRDPSRPVMPVDIELTRARPLLIVTGPNAGGKTIALKTLALLCLLTQTGCHVPAAEGARLPLFERIYAIIGDDQSVAENLSTFSAFVKQMREVVAGADRHALVLLDELGAGTDPDEGAALAQAILEELDARGALVVATTHLEPLRAFASTHARARNASVEFDTATLAPTFRLVYDRPGQSYALAIAARLGLGQSLIMRAQSHRSQHAARLGELLAQMDERSRTDADKTCEIERRESETAARLAAARELESEATTRARATVERAKSEATALLTEIRRAVSAEWERLKRPERSRPSLDESRRRLSEVSARLAPVIIPEPNHETLEPGMLVSAAHLGIHGELVAIAGSTATVSTGSVTVRVPVAALRRAERAPEVGTRAVIGGRSVTWGASKGPPSPPTRDNGGTEGGGRRAPSELLLLGRTTDEARDLVEKYLDDAFLGGLVNVRLIHGKGTGALRKAVRALLAEHPLVESFRDGEPSEGGAGATVAALKVS
jgi:DNA mismatch repair protein MutS2